MTRAFAAAARRFLVVAALCPAARRFRVVAAFAPAARRFRVVAAFRAAALRFRVTVAFLAADFAMASECTGSLGPFQSDHSVIVVDERDRLSSFLKLRQVSLRPAHRVVRSEGLRRHPVRATRVGPADGFHDCVVVLHVQPHALKPPLDRSSWKSQLPLPHDLRACRIGASSGASTGCCSSGTRQAGIRSGWRTCGSRSISHGSTQADASSPFSPTCRRVRGSRVSCTSPGEPNARSPFLNSARRPPRITASPSTQPSSIESLVQHVFDDICF
jgi:hypothetical protein